MFFKQIIDSYRQNIPRAAPHRKLNKKISGAQAREGTFVPALTPTRRLSGAGADSDPAALRRWRRLRRANSHALVPADIAEALALAHDKRKRATRRASSAAGSDTGVRCRMQGTRYPLFGE
jgi:hypothetical protein